MAYVDMVASKQKIICKCYYLIITNTTTILIKNKLKIKHFIQQFHFWVYTQNNLKQGIEQIQSFTIFIAALFMIARR